MLSRKTKRLVSATLLATMGSSFAVSAKTLNVNEITDISNNMILEEVQAEKNDSEEDKSLSLAEVTTGAAVHTTDGQVTYEDFEFDEYSGTIIKYHGNKKILQFQVSLME